MLIIFCQNPLQPRQPDSAYIAETAIASSLGLPWYLLDFESVLESNFSQALKRVPIQNRLTLALYRGWMLKPSQYQQLYAALYNKGIQLINDPTQYTHCHYLPESYYLIAGQTPYSVWLKLEDVLALDEIMVLLQPFGDKPLILKDYVKSRKHEWFEACYISAASKREVVEPIVRRFVELQGDDLNEGLVFREFIEFEPLTLHSKSGMPLTSEFRLFFLDQQLAFSTQYWDEGTYTVEQPSFESFNKVASNIQSRFFTMDVAKTVAGTWLIVELGDGQVAGLPNHADLQAFYETLTRSWPVSPQV
jgi:hypothetical protein